MKYFKKEAKAVSRDQQQLFGMAYAYKIGKLPNASQKVRDLANSLSLHKLREFAKTKHKGLPESKR
jgi:hypothetical protein